MTLERIEHKVFASEAPLDEMGQFGSALATTKLNTKDVAEIQALPAYTKGWGSAIISENNYPAMEEMNGVLNVMSYHTGYLYQEGIPPYSATQEYSATSWVKDLAGEKVYKSLQDNNKGHSLTDTSWWEEVFGNNVYVKKSGDTMTGNLNINRNKGTINMTGVGYKGIATTSTDIDYTSTDQVSLQGMRIVSNDKNGQWFGYFQNGVGSGGNMFTGISARRMIDGTAKECAISCNVDKTGGVYTLAPTPATGDNSTKIATTAYCVNMRCTTKATTTSSASVTRPCWVVQNYVSGASWYRVWSDGWIEQGGSFSIPQGDKEITLLKAYTSTNYSIQCTSIFSGSFGNMNEDPDIHIVSRTASKITFRSVWNTKTGVWYACGY